MLKHSEVLVTVGRLGRVFFNKERFSHVYIAKLSFGNLSENYGSKTEG